MAAFAFDEGQGLSEHTAPFDALAQAVEGEAEITVAGKPIAVKTGEIILHASTAPRRQSYDSGKMLLIMVRSWSLGFGVRAASTSRQFCRISACELTYGQTLSKAPIFSGLTGSELSFLSHRAVARSYAPGEIVLTSGPCSGMYVVESGTVRIYKNSAGDAGGAQHRQAGQFDCRASGHR